MIFWTWTDCIRAELGGEDRKDGQGDVLAVLFEVRVWMDEHKNALFASAPRRDRYKNGGVDGRPDVLTIRRKVLAVSFLLRFRAYSFSNNL